MGPGVLDAPAKPYTYTALIWTGIILCLTGTIIAIIGLGEPNATEISFKDFKIKTTQTGLLILLVGAILAGIVAVKLPKDTVVLTAENKYSFTEKLVRILPLVSLLLGLIAVVWLIISWL